MKKTKRIELRVTETTYIEMLDKAIEKGMSMSEYIRYTSPSMIQLDVLRAFNQQYNDLIYGILKCLKSII